MDPVDNPNGEWLSSNLHCQDHAADPTEGRPLPEELLFLTTPPPPSGGTAETGNVFTLNKIGGMNLFWPRGAGSVGGEDKGKMSTLTVAGTPKRERAPRTIPAA